MAVHQTGDTAAHDQSNELRPLSSQNSRSAPDLTTVGRRLFSRSGFPPGITVDELRLYRRKRPSDILWPHDNLTLRTGSFKSLKTEYERCFKNYYDFGSCGELGISPKDLSPVRATKPEDTWKVEGALELQPEYHESFIERPKKIQPLGGSFELIDLAGETKMKEIPSRAEQLLTEISANYVRYPPIERPPLLKTPTNLKLEGDCCYTTESAEKFIEYLLTKRPDLARRATTLKLEGDMDNTKTEMREQFVPYAYQARPPLCKKFTNLHLEGDLDILTEKQDKYGPYQVQRRPKLTKKATNLHVEGELDFLPEYRKEFVEFKAPERVRPVLPVNHLKTDGFYAEPQATAYDLQIHPKIPFLRSENDGGHTDFPLVKTSRISARRCDENYFEGTSETMETKTESSTQYVEKPMERREKRKVANNLQLEGRIDMNPEYRNAYVDYDRDGRVSPGRLRSRKYVQPTHHLKVSEGRMDNSAEYSRCYVDFPRERPKIIKPPGHLSSEGEMEHTTEKSEKYIAFPHVPKAGPLKRGTELKLEGEFECQPEYRKAYIDYLTRERIERKCRPLDHLGKEPNKRVVEQEPSILKVALVNVPEVHEPTPSTSQITEETSSGTTEPPTTAEKKMETLKPIAPPIRPPSSTTSSVPSSPKIDKSSRLKSSSQKSAIRDRSLSQVESHVFGPKLTPPRKTTSIIGSRSSSPLPQCPSSSTPAKRKPRTTFQQQISSTSDSDFNITERHRPPTVRKFKNPVRVENLALRPLTPVNPLYNHNDRNSTKTKWMMRDNNNSSMESNNSSAFVVLDKEVNNNPFGSSNDDEGNFRETDKWTPSWYNPNYPF